MNDSINDVLQILINKGVIIVDPRQTYVSEDVKTDRIYKGSTLFPGTRLSGSKTLIGSFAKISTEGPAVINDSIISAHAEVASGYISEATLLPKARAGANSYFRQGTLLEEEASTAHSVGLKQSILMHSVTLGSLINFCDILISGGSSRVNHTEVGSGFIHFNFTPWGRSGDKATPSLIGNVTDGVFLDQERIFLGGLSGIVGPISIDFGALTVAGQVIRQPVVGSTIYSKVGDEINRNWTPSEYKLSIEHMENVRDNNAAFITELYALLEWYSKVRLKRCDMQKDTEMSLVTIGAIDTIHTCIIERVNKYNDFAREWSLSCINKTCLDENRANSELPPSSQINWEPGKSHAQWVMELTENEKHELHNWLKNYSENIKNKIREQLLS
ncbi:MAG: hypothetical protein FWH57_01740 [Oscillospiraceae bacterium]|nr:hypothetical protein [Oscillospiraceae bacterium]